MIMLWESSIKTSTLIKRTSWLRLRLVLELCEDFHFHSCTCLFPTLPCFFLSFAYILLWEPCLATGRKIHNRNRKETRNDVARMGSCPNADFPPPILPLLIGLALCCCRSREWRTQDRNQVGFPQRAYSVQGPWLVLAFHLPVLGNFHPWSDMLSRSSLSSTSPTHSHERLSSLYVSCKNRISGWAGVAASGD